MKKRLLWIGILSCVCAAFCSETLAQLPEVSTATEPVWYYIQTLGKEDREGLMYTAESDNKVYGRAVKFTSDQAQKDMQWWRFEKNGDQYTAINKATEKQLDIAYDTSKGISHATVSTTSSATFGFEANGEYFNIKSSVAPEGGTASKVYAHQANNYDSRNYVIMFESSGYNSDENSKFSFIPVSDIDDDNTLPEVSTSDKPVWYHIQVLGDAARADLVYTVENDEVYGRSIVNSIAPADVDPQLWRFELNNDEYEIINKATGKKLDIAYAGSPRNITIATIADEPITKWKLLRVNKNYYQIMATATPAGGNSTEIYAHQANSAGGVRDFVIMFVSTQYYTEPSSYFRFLPYTDYNVQISDETNEVWYYLTSAADGYADKCVTDVTAQSLPYIKFAVENFVEDNEYQQWKAIKNSTDPDDKKVQLVNRATGNIIQTNSVENGIFNYVQYTTFASESNGWNLDYIGSGQYEISGIEDDNIMRYLFVGDESSLYPDVYVAGETNSNFAWQFVAVETDDTDLPVVIEDDITVYTRDRRIYVEGADNYKVWNIQGLQMNKDVQLPIGVYVVMVNGKTAKVLVK